MRDAFDSVGRAFAAASPDNSALYAAARRAELDAQREAKSSAVGEACVAALSALAEQVTSLTEQVAQLTADRAFMVGQYEKAEAERERLMSLLCDHDRKLGNIEQTGQIGGGA